MFALDSGDSGDSGVGAGAAQAASENIKELTISRVADIA
jgi:hypothetical protein